MNESTDRVAANAVGGKTARPCDSCVRRRARWYCAADDAFLCQPCDADVHSANPLARRHVRVRLKTASAVLKPDEDDGPAWHRGFRRKARTPRLLRPAAGTTKLPSSPPPLARSGPIVPDLEGSWDDTSSPVEDEEEHLLYLVPIFDPVLAEFCSPPSDTKPQLPMPECPQAGTPAADCLVGFHPTDVELAEFDVESLLGHGLEDDAFCMEGLGLADGGDMGESLAGGCFVGDERVKAEVDADTMFHPDVEMETLDINFDYESPMMDERAGDASGERRFDLRLDYDGVIAAWSGQGCSPWSGGERPHLNLDDCWPEYPGMWGGEVQGAYGGEVGTGGHVADCGREARVSRYREKRRTRLFSKKIRYEVRKLNAEKRPRMKGRFVKRVATSFPNTTPTQPGFRF